LVIGHGDWYTANLRWKGDDLCSAWDWDSAIAAPEPVIAGLASAVYPVTETGTEATVAESEAFLDTYQRARGWPFNRSEWTQAWAAGLWVRAFDAKKQFTTEGTAWSLSEAEALERGRRALGL
jgi:aminoglycoside phosphotransferase (APT) family kinase protein